MNHVYRIVWNETLGAWVAVAENVKRKGKRSTSKSILQAGLFFTASVMTINGYAYDPVETCKPPVNSAKNSCVKGSQFNQVIKLSSSNNSSNGLGAVAKGENGKDGRDGALFVKPKAGGNGGDAGGIVYKPASESFDQATGTITVLYNTYILDKDNKEVLSGQRKIVYRPNSLASILDSSVVNVSYIREIYDMPLSEWKLISTQTITASKVTVAAGEFTVGIADGYPMDVNYSATEPTAAEPAIVNPRLSVEISSNNSTRRQVVVTGTTGLYAVSEGGKGGKGGDYILGGSGKPGGTGGDASDAYLAIRQIDLTMQADKAVGVYVKSKGGKGGDGGGAYGAIVGGGGGGNAGGEGKAAIVDVANTSIVMNGDNSVGILAVSEGGEGGNAGGTVGLVTHQGKNQTAGKAGDVTITVDDASSILMKGNESVGILGQSVGGAGGNTGFAVSIANLGGKGGSGGDAGAVNIDNSALVVTKGGTDSSAIIAQSLGGGGGSGRFSAAAYSLGAQGGAGGNSGAVSVTNNNILSTAGEDSHGILAQAIGGGGGNSSKSIGFAGIGGNATSGGAGGVVTVKTESNSQISVKGKHSSGIVAQSIGGGGGNAGLTAGVVSIGGDGGTGNDAKSVTVDNKGAITTEGSEDAAGILAQSIGGGGGNGSMSVAAGGLVSIAIGGQGAAGGVGGQVTVTSSKDREIKTKGEDSSAIVAQSIGGGGGNGGMAIAANASISSPITASVALGGKGGAGAGSNNVTVTNDSKLTTNGNRSTGITAQSIGGGGGNGGIAVAASAGVSAITVNVALGGTGGDGSQAKNAIVNNSGVISTEGIASTGILAQSIGGGGGNGGQSVSGSLGVNALTVNTSFGGNGSNGGTAGISKVINSGVIKTAGASSSGIVSQSIGGHGGQAGGAVSASAGALAAVNLAFGANGGTGGTAKEASVKNTASLISTAGDNANAVLVQSIGGNGGNGGFSGAANALSSSINLAMSGNGATAGSAGKAILESVGTIATGGKNAAALVAQSIAGNGGNGGLAVSGSVGGQVSANVAVGGDGGTGGKASTVIVNAKKGDQKEETATLSTGGENSVAILAQSIGGAGGSGGLAVTGTVSGIGSYGNVGISLGGSGGSGSTAGEVVVDTDHIILTKKDNSAAILAQSIGGHGGNGGSTVSANAGLPMASAQIAIGGNGGVGGTSGRTAVTSSGKIHTKGENSGGVIAQSLGGGGGNGGFSVAASMSTAANASVALGGAGNNGGKAGAVEIALKNDADKTGFIRTEGNQSIGALAQSIGGQGGNGGFSVAGSLNLNAVGGGGVSVALGGNGGDGGKSGEVTLKSEQQIITGGDFSSGLQAQSIGGNGGNGGFSVAASGTGSLAGVVAPGGPSAAIAVSLGGKGGNGGQSGKVTLTSAGKVKTTGNFSNGVIAQSLAGNGGTGGFSDAFSLTASKVGAVTGSVTVGGDGGKGGSAGQVRVDVTDDIETGYVPSAEELANGAFTRGDNASGIVAQSIGGSGGAGGMSLAGALSASQGTSVALSASVGGAGGAGGEAADVEVKNTGNITTRGEFANGILAQAINGNGGSGGISASLSGAVTQGLGIGASVSLGGNGGGVATNNKTSKVTVENGQKGNIRQIVTQGNFANGIVAQSIGGSGGTGGLSVSGALAVGEGAGAVSVSVGGKGGEGSTSDIVSVKNISTLISTVGKKASAIVAQSLGGNGGSGGMSVSGAASVSQAGAAALSASVGGNGGKGNKSADVTVHSDNSEIIAQDQTQATISTQGESSHGIAAQSIGGGGGDGGISGNLTLSSANSTSLTAAVSVGGNAGDGNTSANVSVISTDNILTEGVNSNAILAQSIAGGGGDGGFGLNAMLNATPTTGINIGASVGGQGGDANSAGNVKVESTGSLVTTNDYSHAVLAQSIGGGGGNGGFTAGLSATSAQTTVGVNANVGGFGGNGGLGGNVDVQRNGDIFTQGSDSAGILAQSIGGGGGNGGLAVSVNLITQDAYAAAFSLGGFGGKGNAAGAVTVKNNGNIVTGKTGTANGKKSQAILAQSIGGGGGNGGLAASLTLKASSQKSGVVLTAAVGGMGADGGTSDTVDVVNIGALYTSGDASQGILAQSIGGGGGDGGSSVSGSLTGPAFGPEAKTTALNVAVGGFGGSGNKSDQVTVTQTGQIFTEGFNASGIQAQSIAGGGGIGGNSTAVTLSIACDEVCDAVSGGVTQTPGDTMITTSIGGWGGSANDAGAVTVNNAGLIQTLGNGSNGIYAQSIGGGGGDGGHSVVEAKTFKPLSPLGKQTFALGVGGYLGSAGNADTVQVNHSDSILTKGKNAKGILAQSIGGGGGNGGNSSGAKVGVGGGAFQSELAEGMQKLSKITGLDLTIADGSSGNGGAVIVNTTLAANAVDINGYSNFILTEGEYSDAIFAQSIGGGGGIGGSVTGGLLAVGGSGGKGGNGGAVQVNNELNLLTLSTVSRGIFAQSIGGGGGAGGDIDGQSTVGIGGAGTMAGHGGTVKIENNGSISTMKNLSQGMLAQSIGGGGGTGGSAEQATVAVGGGALSTLLNEIGVNMQMPVGGNGDIVTVNSGLQKDDSRIDTEGDQASAIVAQSIGGGGGIGGSASGTLSIGGFAAAAGHGGQVIIQNKSVLTTKGQDSSAIVAQSIGGGGGIGGSSAGKDNAEAVVAIGGNGANAGNAGKVNVSNKATAIVTTGENARGIIAQSIGGGGGAGGASKGMDINGTINNAALKVGSLGLGSGVTNALLTPIQSSQSLVNGLIGSISKPLQDYFNNVKTIAGGNADSVQVKNALKSNIVTKGQGADAIVAQSIGGGGGTSGSASGILIAGAAQGAQGNAGTVNVDNDGGLYTEGDHAAAIVAQSIGGGGGLSSGLDQTAAYAQLGANQASGVADTVSVNHSGIIATSGRLSQGILAQSISGGGGSIGLSEHLQLGGTNTAQSHAKDVSVNNVGYVETETDGSSAIVAQSIGGGGGFAAGTQEVLTSKNGSGNSGKVSIINTAASGTQPAGIFTTGRFAHGIIAQSIAGGGGYSNLMDATGNLTGFFAGTAGGTGTAGNVSVDQLGNISTKGEGSYSLFTQSAGSTNGNISINIGKESVLIGGLGSGAAVGMFDGLNNQLTNAGYLTAFGQTEGLYLNENMQLTAAGWLDGNTVNAGTGNDTVQNNSFMTGSLWLDDGSNTLTNAQNAWLLAGQMIQMNLAGAANKGEAVNAGNWAVGGVNRVDATYLDGNFTQSSTGNMYWDYDLDRSSVQPSAVPVFRNLMSAVPSSSLGASDMMTVTGTAVLGGTVSVNLMNPNKVTPGTFDQTLVSAQNVVDTGFTVSAVPSAVALFSKVVTNNTSAIRANIDFARTALSENGQRLGQAINAIQLDQTSPAFEPVAAALLYRPNIAALQTAYDSISGEGNAAILQTAFNHTQGVMNDISVQSDYWRSRSNYAKNNNVYTVICDQSTADGEQCIDDSQWRVWISGQNGKYIINNDTRYGTADYSADSYRTVAGLDYAIDKSSLFGLAFGSSKTQFNVADRDASGLVESNSLALYGSKDFEKLYLKGALSYDWLEASTRRFAFVEGSAAPIVPVASVANNLQAEFEGKTLNGRVEAGYKTNWKKLNITPFAGLQVSLAKMGAATEKAAETDDLLALAYSKNDAYSVPVFVGAQFDSMFMFSEGSIQPYAKLSFAHDFSTKRPMEAGFVSAPGYKFEVQGAVPDANTMDVNIGFKMTSITNLAFYGQFNGQYSDNGAKNEGGTLGLEIHW
ncbi:ESPR-type extended signal peptide-containing protein [Acinetobacter sp.]|uniref:ESPR-type extended signal peptide-containing protein n=1 Tax=Acinetobacter sp. TaxID=472 RepID=UPI0035B1EDAD